MAYGWLAWRTGSILWGAIAHTYILTLAHGGGRGDSGLSARIGLRVALEAAPLVEPEQQPERRADDERRPRS